MTTLTISQLTEARESIEGASSRQLKAAASQYGITARNPQTKQVWKSAELRSAILAVINEQVAEASEAVSAPKLDRIQRATQIGQLASSGLNQAQIGEQLGVSAKQVAREIATLKLYLRPALGQLIDSGAATWQQLYKAAAFSKKNDDQFFINLLTA